MDAYWCGYCGQHMDPTDQFYCSTECSNGDRAPIFTSLPHSLPSNVALNGDIPAGNMPWKEKPASAKVATVALTRIPETASLRSRSVSHFPLDILLHILDYAQHSDLPALCRVSRALHYYASDMLYRDISAVNILDVCKTLSRSPVLAARVKHFELTPVSRGQFVGEDSEYVLVGNALRLMTCLRSLKLTMGETHSGMLALCTSRIHVFQCSFRCDDNLIRFLRGQPELAVLKLWRDLEGHHVLSNCLTKLTKLNAPFSWLSTLIPGRPVQEVVFYDQSRSIIPAVDIGYLVLSSSPILTLAIGSPTLRALSLSQIASILPALEMLYITTPRMCTSCHYHYIETKPFAKWLQGLLSVLPTLRSITLIMTKQSFSWFDRDALSFLETAVKFASNVDMFVMESLQFPAIRSTWKRVDDKWNLIRRERRGVSKQQYRLQWEQRKKELRAQLTARFPDYHHVEQHDPEP